MTPMSCCSGKRLPKSSTLAKFDARSVVLVLKTAPTKQNNLSHSAVHNTAFLMNVFFVRESLTVG